MSQYNQKLFSGGVRSRLHHWRFAWLQKHLNADAGAYSLFELGCFDCRSLSFIPQPARYAGADAGWEGGLYEAQTRYADTPGVTILKAQCAEDLDPLAQETFDYAIALETLEHVPEERVDGYLAFLARVTTRRLLVTVPVEVGPVFLAKHLAKTLVSPWKSGETGSYTLPEVLWATLGDVSRVRRDQHKGFDYRVLRKQIETYFTVEKTEGIPFRRWPGLSFQVGMVATPKRNEA